MKHSLAAALLAATGIAHAATVWDEAVQGDLSGNGLAPTPVSMSPGHNVVLGTMGNAGNGIDRDYFSFTIPAGYELSALWLLPTTDVSGGASFFAIQAGPRVTTSPTGAGVEALYGFNHYGTDLVGQDILLTIVGPQKAPVPAGPWSVWIQETGGEVRYGFDFVITATVPEPATALSLGLGLLGLACRRSVLQRR